MWVGAYLKVARQYRTLFATHRTLHPTGTAPLVWGAIRPQQIDPKYRVSLQTQGNITTEVYQAQLRHKKFPEQATVWFKDYFLLTSLPT